ncbi:DUF3644 domain-containing protein [Geobacter sulfurreducens]|uniref:DUF3644 domain-containing protein n=1 Tax=Geobacter sulfurreducens TaxID=35554 RepID=UPI0001E3428F|nr:DUF3644 domain-containing protein [Geobacter sulfurreducens]ADN78318.1 hypothetical protein KN400_3422 [Geobacter sulfurreducens KN400]
MKKRAKMLFDKSLDSLLLSIEHFNRPWDRGRPEAVLILMDRAFELLMKAIILNKGGKIREPFQKETIGHEKCVRKCITDAQVKCMTEEQGLTIQIINSLRDAAQHDIVEVAERDLYLYSQAGVTLYRDMIMDQFNEDLRDHFPERVLPVSTEIPKDLHAIVEADFEEIKELVRPGARRHIEAMAKLKALAIIESSLEGVRLQPSEPELMKLAKEVKAGKSWQDIFPGVASLQLATDGEGLNVHVRITKKEGDAVHVVPEGTPGATVLAVKRVNELDFYSLGIKNIADQLGISDKKALALVDKLGLQSSEDFFKVIKIGKNEFKRYSGRALKTLREELPKVNIDEVWQEYVAKRRG